MDLKVHNTINTLVGLRSSVLSLTCDLKRRKKGKRKEKNSL